MAQWSSLLPFNLDRPGARFAAGAATGISILIFEDDLSPAIEPVSTG